MRPRSGARVQVGAMVEAGAMVQAGVMVQVGCRRVVHAASIGGGRHAANRPDDPTNTPRRRGSVRSTLGGGNEMRVEGRRSWRRWRMRSRASGAGGSWEGEAGGAAKAQGAAARHELTRPPFCACVLCGWIGTWA